MMSASLQRFERKKDGLYNFRCPYCGDSQKRKDKARGYLFKKKNDYVYKCHNCGVGRTLSNFLKDNNRMLYDEYVMERYRAGLTGKNTQTASPKFEFKKPVFKKSEQDIHLQRISELNNSHLARQYLEQRKIEDLDYFFYCPKFKEWTNKQKETFSDMRGDGPRIILPLYTADKKLFGFQGRSLSKATKLRYITVILDENQPKLFGLDKINLNETIYITEGPFDSTFIRNSVAMCGSDVHVDRRVFRDIVWVYDNEPRNREIIKQMYSVIDKGYNIVIWPDDLKQKDINDMILSDLTSEQIADIIHNNTFSGLAATAKLDFYKRVQI